MTSERSLLGRQPERCAAQLGASVARETPPHHHIDERRTTSMCSLACGGNGISVQPVDWFLNTPRPGTCVQKHSAEWGFELPPQRVQ
eukprot:801732-Heterocapsa_arctica.AAC.1